MWSLHLLITRKEWGQKLMKLISVRHSGCKQWQGEKATYGVSVSYWHNIAVYQTTPKLRGLIETFLSVMGRSQRGWFFCTEVSSCCGSSSQLNSSQCSFKHISSPFWHGNIPLFMYGLANYQWSSGNILCLCEIMSRAWVHIATTDKWKLWPIIQFTSTHPLDQDNSHF